MNGIETLQSPFMGYAYVPLKVSVSGTLHVQGFNLQSFHLSLPGVDMVFCLNLAVLRAAGSEEQKLQNCIVWESSLLLAIRQEARG